MPLSLSSFIVSGHPRQPALAYAATAWSTDSDCATRLCAMATANKELADPRAHGRARGRLRRCGEPFLQASTTTSSLPGSDSVEALASALHHPGTQRDGGELVAAAETAASSGIPVPLPHLRHLAAPPYLRHLGAPSPPRPAAAPLPGRACRHRRDEARAGVARRAPFLGATRQEK